VGVDGWWAVRQGKGSMMESVGMDGVGWCGLGAVLLCGLRGLAWCGVCSGVNYYAEPKRKRRSNMSSNTCGNHNEVAKTMNKAVGGGGGTMTGREIEGGGAGGSGRAMAAEPSLCLCLTWLA